MSPLVRTYLQSLTDPGILDKSQNLARKTAQTHRFEGAAKMEKVLTREKDRQVILSKINYLWPGGASR